MKKTYLLLSALGMMILSSCSKQTDCPDGDLLSSLDQVRFSATISEAVSTRAMNNAWEPADAIGVYALQAGKMLEQANLYDSKANVKYTTPGDGKFSAASEGISFPENGNLDFVAYYPYMESLTDFSYPIDVTDQTKASKIDVLYSNNIKGANKSNANVGLVFNHALSALILQVSAGDGIPELTGLSAKIEGLKVKGALNLVDGTVSASGNAMALTPVVEVKDKNATVSAIVVPDQDLSAVKVILTLNGKVYEWTPSAKMLEGTKKYTYMLQLTTSGIVLINPDATINDWNEGYKGTTNIILQPNEGVQFTVSTTAVSLKAKANLSQVITLTTDAAQAWTATSDATWLNIDPKNGVGAKDITLTADENTENTERTAKVTFTPTGLAPVEVMVTQAAAEAVTPTPTPDVDNLLAPGTNFENWDLFNSSLSKYQGKKNIQSYVTFAPGQGRENSGALHIESTPKGNDYAFTIAVPKNASFEGKKKIILWVKGTVSGKSFSFNVYKEDGKYTSFNLADFSDDATIDPAPKNSYTGSIDTNGQWKKVTLNISSLALNTTEGQSLLACKVGKGAAWDVYIDDITIE